jgi:oxygen-independent coproporphyrinogen-3 oxidase
VTIYQTEIPYHTHLAKAVRGGQVTGGLVSWEDKRARLNDAFEQLTADGYTVVSAYAAAKDPVRHGFNYCEHLWRGGDMLGVGVAAFSYLGGAHFQNMEDLHGYCEQVEKGDLPLHRATRLGEREQLVREFILQLKWGVVDLAPFRRKFAVEISEAFRTTLHDLQTQGLLNYDRDRVALTRRGLLQTDRLLPLFYDAQYRKVRYA